MTPILSGRVTVAGGGMQRPEQLPRWLQSRPGGRARLLLVLVAHAPRAQGGKGLRLAPHPGLLMLAQTPSGRVAWDAWPGGSGMTTKKAPEAVHP
jgi:hypothetical protein